MLIAVYTLVALNCFCILAAGLGLGATHFATQCAYFRNDCRRQFHEAYHTLALSGVWAIDAAKQRQKWMNRLNE